MLIQIITAGFCNVGFVSCFMYFILKFSPVSSVVIWFPCPHVILQLVPLFNVSCSDEGLNLFIFYVMKVKSKSTSH